MDKMESEKPAAPKNPQSPHEGFGDGDDDDPEGRNRIGILMLTMSLGADLMASAARARAHGMGYDDIREVFDAQLSQLITAEKAVIAVNNGMSVEDAKDALGAAAKKQIDRVLGGSATDDNKKSS